MSLLQFSIIFFHFRQHHVSLIAAESPDYHHNNNNSVHKSASEGRGRRRCDREIRRVGGVDSRTKRAITRSAAGRARGYCCVTPANKCTMPNKLLVSPVGVCATPRRPDADNQSLIHIRSHTIKTRRFNFTIMVTARTNIPPAYFSI